MSKSNLLSRAEDAVADLVAMELLNEEADMELLNEEGGVQFFAPRQPARPTPVSTARPRTVRPVRAGRAPFERHDAPVGAKNRTPSRTMSITTPKMQPTWNLGRTQLLEGINAQQVQGFQNLNNKMVNVIAGNPKITYDKRALLDKHSQQGRISKQDELDCRWLAENWRLAGWRTARVYNNREPESAAKWYDQNFKPTMVGLGRREGAFKGGWFKDALTSKVDAPFPPVMGKPDGVKLPSGIALRQVNPFPIRLQPGTAQSLVRGKTDDVSALVADVEPGAFDAEVEEEAFLGEEGVLDGFVEIKNPDTVEEVKNAAFADGNESKM